MSSTCLAFRDHPQNTEQCGQPGVVSLVGMGAFQNVGFCLDHAKGYVDWLEQLYLKEKEGTSEIDRFNAETTYCKWHIARNDLAKYLKELEGGFVVSIRNSSHPEAGDDQVPCGICGDPTRMTGTKRCDRCWELERRIEDDPKLAKLILERIESANQI